MAKKTESDHFDQIDDLFNKITSEEAIISGIKTVTKTVESVGKEINRGINESLKNKGYDNLGEYIQAEMSSKKREKPTPKTSFRSRAQLNDRYTFFVDALEHVTYDLKYRGLYREGHQEAIKNYLEIAKSYVNDMSSLQKRLIVDLKDMQLEVRKEKRNRWNEGYLNGLQFISHSLQNSKLHMMSKIKREVENNR